jgi:hypothetical protein
MVKVGGVGSSAIMGPRCTSHFSMHFSTVDFRIDAGVGVLPAGRNVAQEITGTEFEPALLYMQRTPVPLRPRSVTFCGT